MTRLEYQIDGADFMVLDGEQIVIRPEDLPNGCEMVVGKEAKLWMNGKAIDKETGPLTRFGLSVLTAGGGRPSVGEVRKLWKLCP